MPPETCGWLPIDARRFDFVACAGYKWLLAPRGIAFMAVRPERLAEVRPSAAGWSCTWSGAVPIRRRVAALRDVDGHSNRARPCG